MADETTTDRAPRLYLIDGYSNIFRAFYAIRNLSSSRGEPTNAVYGFVQMLRKLLREEQPELVGVALDVSSDTVRRERYEDYKAHRKPMPEDLRPQIPWIRKALEAYRIPILEMERYEADDVLGTLAKKASAAGYDVILVSADKDLMQLVGPRVSLMHTGRDKVYDPALVAEDFGVPPEQVVDVLALMGDASDNVPGVPGIGAKGAQKLIQEHGSLEALLEHARRDLAEELPGGAGAEPGPGADVEGAGDHPHRPRRRVRPGRPAPRPARPRGAARAVRRDGVLQPARGAEGGRGGRGGGGRGGGDHRSRRLGRAGRPARGRRRAAARRPPGGRRGPGSGGRTAGGGRSPDLRRFPARRSARGGAREPRGGGPPIRSASWSATTSRRSCA